MGSYRLYSSRRVEWPRSIGLMMQHFSAEPRLRPEIPHRDKPPNNCFSTDLLLLESLPQPALQLLTLLLSLGKPYRSKGTNKIAELASPGPTNGGR